MRTQRALLILAVLIMIGGFTAIGLKNGWTDKPVVITKTVQAPAKIITRWRTRTITRTVTQTVTDPSAYNADETNCITNLWHSYVTCASNGPCGDPSLFQADCPNVHINGLSG